MPNSPVLSRTGYPLSFCDLETYTRTLQISALHKLSRVPAAACQPHLLLVPVASPRDREPRSPSTSTPSSTSSISHLNTRHTHYGSTPRPNYGMSASRKLRPILAHCWQSARAPVIGPGASPGDRPAATATGPAGSRPTPRSPIGPQSLPTKRMPTPRTSGRCSCHRSTSRPAQRVSQSRAAKAGTYHDTAPCCPWRHNPSPSHRIPAHRTRCPSLLSAPTRSLWTTSGECDRSIPNQGAHGRPDP